METRIMEINFAASLKHVLEHEGGWADHPKDPGGATMKGVALITYRRHFGEDKSKQDLRNISDTELGHIYRSAYWDKCRCDALPAGVDYAVFDAAVNSGPGRSARWLQAAIGAEQDGGIGPETLARVAAHNAVQIAEMLCDRRLKFLQSLDTWETFGQGWGRPCRRRTRHRHRHGRRQAAENHASCRVRDHQERFYWTLGTQTLASTQDSRGWKIRR